MPHRLTLVYKYSAPCAFLTSNGIGLGLFAQTGEATTPTIVGGITAITFAVLGLVKILTPALVDAIRTIGPALAELHKQREELKKGSFQAQMEELLKRVNDANEKLHESRNERNAAELRHQVELQRLQQLADTLHEELTAARAEIRELKDRLAAQVGRNTRDIERLKSDSGTTPSPKGI